MRQPVHAYSSLSITIHHRAGKQFAGAGRYSRAVAAPHLPWAARRVARPVSARPHGTPSGWRSPAASVPRHAQRRAVCVHELLRSRPAWQRGARSGRRPAGPEQPGPADAGTRRPGGSARGPGPHPRAGALA